MQVNCKDDEEEDNETNRMVKTDVIKLYNNSLDSLLDDFFHQFMDRFLQFNEYSIFAHGGGGDGGGGGGTTATILYRWEW